MTGLICQICGGLLHVGLTHYCVIPESGPELGRRQRRAQRFQATLNASLDQMAAALIGDMQARFAARTYTVIPEPPPEPDREPYRTTAYVGHRLAEIETRGAELIEGELA